MKQELFRKVKCVLCGSNKERVLKVEKKDSKTFKIIQCNKCGLVFTNPQPIPKVIRTSHNKAEKVGFYSYEGAEAYRYHYINGINIMKEYFNGGKLLDVGCGVGYFIKMVQNSGFDSSGIDFSSVAAEVAREKFGLTVIVGELAEVGFKPDSFDIVTLWNVLEHFYDPVKEISMIYKLLKKKGILFIETPNILLRSIVLRFSLTKIILKLLHKDISLIPWEHLFYWTPNTLKRLLLKEGFKEIKFYTVNAPVENPLNNLIQYLKRILFIGSIGQINLYFPLVAVAVK
ncbi:methyltransferase domain-containing protein [candidate division WOR-3 bacterium]|nr:methyltransferase domain-containing protein [candidate division WOR-3 bacterium]